MEGRGLKMKKQFTPSECKAIYDEARKYLLTLDKVDNALLNKYLDEWKEKKNLPKSIADLLWGILNSVKNRQGMPNTIGEVENLRPYLCEFEPHRIITEFQDDWRKVFTKIKEEYKPNGNMNMNITNERGYWVIFSKAVISASNFLARFDDVDKFDKFVKTFYFNEYTQAALPLLLEREINGLGFALACDFLKDNGYPEFVKPDVHIKKIFKGIGLSDSDKDYEVYKDVRKFAKEIGEKPFKVDKMFWLVGSGYFYDDKKRIGNKGRIQTNRDKFISDVNKLFSAL
jgi:hypothetical protein